MDSQSAKAIDPRSFDICLSVAYSKDRISSLEFNTATIFSVFDKRSLAFIHFSCSEKIGVICIVSGISLRIDYTYRGKKQLLVPIEPHAVMTVIMGEKENSDSNFMAWHSK